MSLNGQHKDTTHAHSAPGGPGRSGTPPSARFPSGTERAAELNGPRGAGSAPGIRLGRLALELQRHERFIAYDPGVVARLETVGVTRAEVGFSAVGRRDVDLARHDISQVCSLATISADHRLDAVRPLPTRLKDKAAYGGVAQVDDAHAGLLRGADLIGVVHVLVFDAGHRLVLLRRTSGT